MASIVSLKNTMVKDGILHLKDCPLIWRPPLFPPVLHEPLLKILESFQVLYRLRDSSSVRTLSIQDVTSRSQKSLDDTDDTSSDFSMSDALDFSSLPYSLPPYLASQSAPMALSAPSPPRPSPRRSPALAPSPSSSLSHSPSLNSLSSSRPSISQELSTSSPSESPSYLGKQGVLGSLGVDMEGKCIIPALLPEDRPLEMKRVWNRERDRERGSDDVIARVFQFDFLPLGFFSRLMVQLLHLLPPLLYWQRYFVSISFTF